MKHIHGYERLIRLGIIQQNLRITYCRKQQGGKMMMGLLRYCGNLRSHLKWQCLYRGSLETDYQRW